MQELKPCPFCGGSEIYAEEYEHHPGAVRWRVFCAGCMAGIDTGTRQSMGQAAQDWNRRAERTCKRRNHDTDNYCMRCCSCSRCNAGWFEDIYDKPFSYCPHCGAKVVDE